MSRQASSLQHILPATHPPGFPTDGAKPRCVTWLADLPFSPDKERIPDNTVTLNRLTLLLCFDSDMLQAGMSEAQGTLSLLDPLHKSPANGVRRHKQGNTTMLLQQVKVLIPRYNPTRFEMMLTVLAAGRVEAAFSGLSKLWSRRGRDHCRKRL